MLILAASHAGTISASAHHGAVYHTVDAPAYYPHFAGVSNPIRYDSLLVHHLGRELDAALAGRPLRRLRLDARSRRAALVLDRDALLLDLHPRSGWIGFGPSTADDVAAELPRAAAIAGVRAPPDERWIEIHVRGTPADGVRRLIVELLTNQWNLLALDADDRVRHVLWTRTAGKRPLRLGARYEPPPPARREGARSKLGRKRWRELLSAAPAAAGPAHATDASGGAGSHPASSRLVRLVAWTSPLNTAWILGADGDAVAADFAATYDRYAELIPADVVAAPAAGGANDPAAPGANDPAAPSANEEAARPRVARAFLRESEPAVYVHALGGPARTCESLLAALRAAAGATTPAPTPESAAVPPELVARLERRLDAVHRRLARLEQEQEDARPEAARLRQRADLLLAQPHLAPRGTRHAALSDFQGGTVDVDLDPALDAVANAQRVYDAARRRERAAERLPRLVGRARGEAGRVERLLERARSGRVEDPALPAELAEEVAIAAGAAGGGAGSAHRAAGGAAAGASPLPYRTYRTSGGLEVRVGRGSRANDDLTFRHSAPEDVWLHARDAAGAHVILQWGRKDANPPARDIAEAAVLAALRSRARTSGTVAVDWTRRKYVRKPRKAGPGRVVPERVKTIFVEPDSAVARRMAQRD